jgi:DNA-binding MarR family transcriptional regulator
VTITDRGRERARELAARAEAIQDELLAPLTTAERAELVRLLTLLRKGAAPA